ncbi:phospholipase D-like domain-containing protein [Sporosarcina sp. YIM B06819]|uniref:phospholipase D-like domain-containing protein n=1 Tax=Sporosarcina sp. YIM B06819 TaxID=3081769 RepID=UPI00298C1426|nr:phospholipase D-like domain-containing protein [Sporosarcina sp. YIM B06819]
MPNIKTLMLLGFIASLLVNILLLNKLVTKEDASSLSFDSDGISFAFSDVVNDPKTVLLQAINEANNTLDIAIYNFEDREIAQAVLNARIRGVSVRIMTDASKAKKNDQAAILDEFTRNNIVVKINTSRKMHLKMAIIDERLIVTGSYNFTEASADENLEQLMTLSNEELAQEWTGIFTDLWNRGEFKRWNN